MTSERNWLVTNSAGVAEQINEAIVITSSDECLIIRESDAVNMSTICAWRENTIN
jgi:hypothetical protein